MVYALAADIAQELGVTFTSPQTSWATTLIARTQAFIDSFTGRTFEASTPITDERHTVYGTEIYLDRAPVSAVSTVKVRHSYVGATLETLALDVGYAVVDLANGLIRLSYFYAYPAEVLVTYTPAITVPLDVTDATVQMVADRMRGQVLSGGDAPDGVKRYQVGGELTVEMFSPADLSAQSITALTTLKLKRRLVIA